MSYAKNDTQFLECWQSIPAHLFESGKDLGLRLPSPWLGKQQQQQQQQQQQKKNKHFLILPSFFILLHKIIFSLNIYFISFTIKL